MPRRAPRRSTARRARKSRVPTAVKRYVRRVTPKVQLKRFAMFSDEISTSTLTGGYSLPQIGITQGTGESNRIGNQITVKGFHVKGVLHNNAATPNYIRVLLLMSSIDTTTVFQDMLIFQDVNLAGGGATVNGTGGLNTMYHPINTKSYTPLWDVVFKLGGSSDSSCTRLYSKFIKMNKKITYNGNSTGDAFQSHQLNLVVIAAESGDDVGVGQTIESSYLARTFFTDA